MTKRKSDRRACGGLIPDVARCLYEEQGLTHEEIAERYNVSSGTVSRWMVRWGIKGRDRSEMQKGRRMRNRLPEDVRRQGLKNSRKRYYEKTRGKKGASE